MPAPHRARKRFGQHFLVDRSVIDAILASLALQPTDNVVEIGPGLGALTRPLLETLPHLTVVEIDRDIVARLAANYPPARLTIHQGDALDFDFAALGPDLRLVGNLPYNISTPLLFHLLEFLPHLRDMTFMLQKEVVARMVAQPSTPDYGRLSVMLQRHCRLYWLLDVPPDAFDPPPKVDSAVVRLLPRTDKTPLDEVRFARVVAAAFGQRRKVLRNTLAGVVPAGAFQALAIDPGLRAENLSVAQFEALAAYTEASC